MIAYKFLRAGRVAPFTGFLWEPGAWVEAADAVACELGIHACRARDLPYWLRTELWEIELDGEIREAERKVVAERGRLVRRIDAWDGAAYEALARDCARQARQLAEESGDPKVRKVADDTDFVLSLGLVSLAPYFASVAAGHAGGAARRVAERNRQAVWLEANVLAA